VILDGKACARPEIEYPCDWSYKLIGTDKEALQTCVFDTVGERPYTTKEGNSSSKGKFHTLNMTCKVESEKDRNDIFKAFSDHDDVKMVI